MVVIGTIKQLLHIPTNIFILTGNHLLFVKNKININD